MERNAGIFCMANQTQCLNHQQLIILKRFSCEMISQQPLHFIFMAAFEPKVEDPTAENTLVMISYRTETLGSEHLKKPVACKYIRLSRALTSEHHTRPESPM
jgi:hypothetical protein